MPQRVLEADKTDRVGDYRAINMRLHALANRVKLNAWGILH